MTEYSVRIEAPNHAGIEEDLTVELAEAMLVFAEDASVTVGAERVGARFGVESSTPDEALGVALTWFVAAVEKCGFPSGPPDSFEIKTYDVLEREVNMPSPTYAGVTEVAKLLGVSKQRISELRMRTGFPAPLAELASGPVWSVGSLTRFMDTWERKPGRPRKLVGSTITATVTEPEGT